MGGLVDAGEGISTTAAAAAGLTNSAVGAIAAAEASLLFPVEEEEVGLDTSHHGGNAYNFEKELDSKA